MSRQRKHTDAAERQRAYRERKRNGATALRLDHPNILNAAEAPVLALPGGADGATKRNAEHTEAAGLLVRIDQLLAGNRVLATVLQPGTSRLVPGTAYPFRVDWLREV